MDILELSRGWKQPIRVIVFSKHADVHLTEEQKKKEAKELFDMLRKTVPFPVFDELYYQMKEYMQNYMKEDK